MFEVIDSADSTALPVLLPNGYIIIIIIAIYIDLVICLPHNPTGLASEVNTNGHLVAIWWSAGKLHGDVNLTRTSHRNITADQVLPLIQQHQSPMAPFCGWQQYLKLTD